MVNTAERSASVLSGSEASEASEASGSPEHWLYLSKRLDLIELPSSLAGDVVRVGPTPYYRLTPAVLAWLEHAVADLDAKRPPPETVATVVAAQTAIYAFARDRLPADALDAARADAKAHGPQPLPDPPAEVGV